MIYHESRRIKVIGSARYENILAPTRWPISLNSLVMSHLLKFNPVLNPKFYFLHSSKTKNCYIYNRLINPFNPYSALLRHQVFNIQIKSIIFYLYLVFPGFSPGTIKISRKTFYKFLVSFLTVKDLITRHICHGDFIQLWICCPVGVKIKFRYI